VQPDFRLRTKDGGKQGAAVPPRFRPQSVCCSNVHTFHLSLCLSDDFAETIIERILIDDERLSAIGHKVVH